MNNEVSTIINQAVKNIIENAGSSKNLTDFKVKHDKKIHFIPQRYRIFGGVLQSMNIKFGNFIEELMALIIKNDGKYEIIEKYSGKKSNSFKLSVDNDDLIDRYVSECQYNNIDTDTAFPELLSKIVEDKDTRLNTFKHDIDLLFKNKETNIKYYLEIKYNDDHDTGKFVDINRKFIKTYAYLARELNIEKYTELVPILFYFNNKKMKGNIYVPEGINIKRGVGFFNEFLNIKYDDVDTYMSNLSESKENIEAFDELYRKVMNF